MKELTIQIRESSEQDGYYYDIFDTCNGEDLCNSLDGGFCTTTLENALGMAVEQTKQLLKQTK